ncbi:MAG TPA: LptA/OstA family protein [bacterium]|nr:LptA/OstA family protein [bacterium]
MPRRLRLAAALVAVGLAGFPGPGGPSASAAAKFSAGSATFAADQVSVDARGSTLIATGHVAVTYGSLRATSDALRLYRPTGVAVFTGHVSVADPTVKAVADTVTLFVVHEQRVARALLAGHASVESRSYALLADRIAADRDTGALAADGNVTLFSQPDLIATGSRVTYDERAQHAVIFGGGSARATIQNRDGRMLGSRMDLFRATDRAVIRGPIDADVYDAKLRGAGATIDLRQGIAVITGSVIVKRRQGTLWADRVTVFYRARRFVAEGATHLTYIDSGDAGDSSAH